MPREGTTLRAALAGFLASRDKQDNTPDYNPLTRAISLSGRGLSWNRTALNGKLPLLSTGSVGMEPSRTPIEQIRFGVYELDLRTGELRKSGAKVRLQEQSFQILQALLKNPGEVVTREELRKTIWPADTFVDFDHGLYSAMTRLRDVLGDSAESPRFIETLSRRGYRFVAPIDRPTSSTLQTSTLATPARQQTAWKPRTAWKSNWLRWAILTTAAIVVIGLAMTGWLSFSRKAHVLTDKDTIVLADFTNTTGDPVFDGTLGRGLSVQLEQSPFLSIVSDQQVQETLQTMGQKPDAKLTPAIARELCQRISSAAVLDGSIAQIGQQYLLTLKAVSCVNGQSLASVEAQASDKNHVLDALGKTASEMRGKLGESLDTVQKFDVPLEQATTPSLEAWQAYNLAGRKLHAMDYSAAIPLWQRAISLDSKFALAYAGLGFTYLNLGETALAAENLKKAYELRDRVSEREKFLISEGYDSAVTGDLENKIQICELWVQTYPRDPGAFNELGAAYGMGGQSEKSLAAFIEAARLAPKSAMWNANLALNYTFLNRWDEARATIQQAQSQNVDTPYFRLQLYQIDFLRNDAAGMANQVAKSMGGPIEDRMLAIESDTAAYSGQLSKANGLTRRAIDSAIRMQVKQNAAGYLAAAALREALFGNVVKVAHPAAEALQISTDRDTEAVVALALALSNNRQQVQRLADDLAKRFPEDTIARFYYLPMIHAAVALEDSQDSKAIDALQLATRYEFVPQKSLYVSYLRGMAHLAARQGALAAAEFQRVLDHPGIVWNDPIGALAHVQLGRACALTGDTAKAKAAYQDFLALWKDADPDIPILRQAKEEYVRLQ
jgi:eukaryotic-like serine/threonine-protein kinase